ncbi:GNAT family N-acetyltransferase [Parasedimentitalea maritima]|uniref:GNAT family N-acetyltransferase n=1 Tax=Parasedimentitalea maritima TaxID=2578117 RepID=A0A6A4RGM1_9RHOB|nr:GNAT family N-acetyltransferase [Zongyanglinia marina]KAE9629950.1 GNAT family N-acetyltransferase [Zongyanglinia marina]
MTLFEVRSERLYCDDWRLLSPDDLSTFFMPEVVKFLPGGFHDLLSFSAQRDFLTELSREAEVVALFDISGAGVGLLVLSYAESSSKERHLGYLFAQSVWGQGRATELISALQQHFGDTDTVLCGGVMADNTASARVLQRAGFHGEGGGEEVVYRWSATSDVSTGQA